jgi:uncharacterized protein DUF4340
MSRWNKILLGALAAQVLLAVLFLTRGEQTGIGTLAPLVTGLDAAKVNRIRISAGAKEDPSAKTDKAPASSASAASGDADKPAIELVKRGAGWVLASHHDYPADPTKVTELLDKLIALQSRGPMARAAARQKQLGVADADFQRRLVIGRDGGNDLTLYVGSAAGGRRTAVRLAGQNDIHAVAGLTAWGVATDPTAWVDPVYFRVANPELVSVEVAGASGRISLERSGGLWIASHDGTPITPGPGETLDQSLIERLAAAVSTIHLAAPADPQRDLSKPTATITLHMKPAAAPATPAATPEAAGATDTPATPPAAAAVSEPGDEHVLDLLVDTNDRYYLRERGNPNAVLVAASSLRDLVELTAAKVISKPAVPPAPRPAAGARPAPAARPTPAAKPAP